MCVKGHAWMFSLRRVACSCFTVSFGCLHAIWIWKSFNFLCDLCSCHVETSIEASGCVLMDTARKERLL